MPKKPLVVTIEKVTRRDELIEALSRESDRGLVLVSASFLDESLEEVLRSKFSMVTIKPKSVVDPLFNTFGPLSTFSAKIKIAFSMDLIKKWVYQDLEILRKLRNTFAHSVGPVEFHSDEVAKLTEKLVGADHAVTAMKEEKPGNKKTTKKKSSKKISRKAAKVNKERLRVIMTVSFIGGLLEAFWRPRPSTMGQS